MLMVVHCIQTCFVTTHLPFKLNAFNLIQPASGFYIQQCPSLRARRDKHIRTFLQPSQHQPTFLGDIGNCLGPMNLNIILPQQEVEKTDIGL